MKNYVRPKIQTNEFLTENLASLSNWLLENSLTDAGITTYIINS